MYTSLRPLWLVTCAMPWAAGLDVPVPRVDGLQLNADGPPKVVYLSLEL
jgi:hypothetical protein